MNRFFNVSMLLVFFMVCVFSLKAQDKSITGVVKDAETGSTLPGVNIQVKGSTVGTISDFDGKYTINAGEGSTLMFSFVGYETQEVLISSQSVVNVDLATDVKSLKEIVVVGYGVQDKKEVTSSVASVKEESFNRGTVNDPNQLLTGKVAGLSIASPGGDPNKTSTIRLRGITSFGANAEPLVVIDGVIGGNLNTVDPNDIASIDVLKDGSAAAIYGTRGSAGVIIVTTKAGKKGKVAVEFNSSYGFENVANTIPTATASEYRQRPLDLIASGKSSEAEGYKVYGGETKWLDAVTKTGQLYVGNLSLSGGTDKTTYRTSVNYRKADGIGINSGFEQFNARLNLTQKALRDRATLSFNISATTKDAQYGFSESFRYAVISNPTLPIYDPTNTKGGGYTETGLFDYFNPVSISKQNKNDGKDTRLLGSVRLDYDFSDWVDGLKIGYFGSIQTESDFRGEYYSKTSRFRGADRNGLARKTTEQRYNTLNEVTLHYDKSFGNITIGALVGYSYQYFKTAGDGSEGGNFLTDAFSYNNLGSALDFKNGLGNVWSYANSNKIGATFARLNANWKGIAYLSVSVRNEGSSKFGDKNKYGVFPAVSGGVDIANLIKVSAINTLKARVSWGITGATPRDSYLSIVRYGVTGTIFNNGAYTNTYGPISNANPELKWESKSEINIGLDYGFLGGKITGTMDWYTRNISDQIVSVNVSSPPNLYNTTYANVGEFVSTGFEFTVNFNNIVEVGSFTWTPGINLSTFSTKIKSLTSGDFAIGKGEVFFPQGANLGAPGQNSTFLVRLKAGDEFGALWGPKKTGVDEKGTPTLAVIESGKDKFCDCNDDRAVIGNGLPDFTLNFTNTFTLGNFDLNFLLRGVFGHQLVNSYRAFYENLESTTIGNYNFVNTKYFDPTITKALFNDSHVENADFVRLDNATLGYNFKFGANSRITKLRLFVSGQNLFTITGYTGVDPEVRYQDQNDADNGGRRSDQTDPLSPGIERRSTYFTTRTFTFGINLGF